MFNPNAVYNNGESALHICTNRGDVKHSLLLIRHGVNINIQDKWVSNSNNSNSKYIRVGLRFIFLLKKAIGKLAE